MAQVSGLPGATLSQMENSTWIFVVLEIIFLHEGKEEGMTFKRWEKTTLMSHVCSCIAVLASNQFFFVCIAVLASNNSTAASSGGTRPGCSEEGATITIRLGVTCKQLSVFATLVIVFEKLFYHFQFEYQILE